MVALSRRRRRAGAIADGRQRKRGRCLVARYAHCLTVKGGPAQLALRIRRLTLHCCNHADYLAHR